MDRRKPDKKSASRIWNTAAYCRLSREDGDKIESNSIAGQRALLEDTISRDPSLQLAGVYQDDGFTGLNMDRPGLQAITKAIKDFNDGKSHLRINAVVVARIDRLGRTLLGTLQFIQDYIHHFTKITKKPKKKGKAKEKNFITN